MTDERDEVTFPVPPVPLQQGDGYPCHACMAWHRTEEEVAWCLAYLRSEADEC